MLAFWVGRPLDHAATLLLSMRTPSEKSHKTDVSDFPADFRDTIMGLPCLYLLQDSAKGKRILEGR